GIDRLSPYLLNPQLGERVANLQSLLAFGPVKPEVIPPLPAKPAAPLYDVALVPAPPDSGALALGAGGKVLGNSSNGPWIYDGSSIRYLIQRGSWETFARGFNSRGDVVGYQLRGDKTRRAFAVVGGSWIDLGTLGGDSSAANTIDDTGHIAGDSTL